MEKSWFKYGNFDTRDYPNLLIELLPNRNIPEKNAGQVNVFGQNGIITYPGGLKNTSRAYSIALISKEDGDVNRFGTLARFVDLKLRSQDICSELTDSYLAFPDDKLPPARKYNAASYSNVAYNKKIFYNASYINSETITNLYNVAARVTVTFNVSPVYYSFRLQSHGISSTSQYTYMYLHFNDDKNKKIDNYSTEDYPLLFVCGVDGGNLERYIQPLDVFWLRDSKLKLHAKALNDGTNFLFSPCYYGIYYTNNSSSYKAFSQSRTGIESRSADGTELLYNKNDEIAIDLQNGEIVDKFGKRCVSYKSSPYHKFFTLPMTLTDYDNKRQQFVRSPIHPSEANESTMYNARTDFIGSGCRFSLEVIKNG